MTAGKGDTRRPAAVSAAEFAERWRATFGRAVAEVKECPCAPCTLDRSVVAAWTEQIDAEMRSLTDHAQA